MTPTLILDLPHPAATDLLGAALARALPAAKPEDGAVLHLSGELGAGKTSLVRSLLRTAGVTGTIRSPTYTLLDTYVAGTLICVHVDLYRLQSRHEVDELGIRDLLGPATLLLIEWPERGFDAAPPADVHVSLSYQGDGRQAALAAPQVGNGSLGGRWLAELARDASLSPYLSNLA